MKIYLDIFTSVFLSFWKEHLCPLGKCLFRICIRLMKIIAHPIKEIWGKLLYSTALGRKLFWRRHATYLFKRYGQLRGGYDTLLPLLQQLKPKRLLEIGCGNGRLFQAYREAGVTEIVGQDISSTAVQYARQRNFPEATLYLCDVSELEFPENYFDLIVCNRVLQHIPPNKIENTIKKFSLFSNHIYVNELTNEEFNEIKYHASLSNYIFIHDYETIFRKLDFHVEKKWVTPSTCDEPSQLRYIFAKG